MKFMEKMAEIYESARDLKSNLQVASLGSKEAGGMVPSKEDGMVQLKGGGNISHRSLEAAKLLLDVYEGRKDTYFLKEAMTTIDFPLLFGDLLYRQMLGNYTAWPSTVDRWMRGIKVKDLRNLNLYTLDGGQASLTTTIKEREPYPEITFTEGRYQASVAKYGRSYGISMEMVLNDDLNAFQSRPRLMATGARRGEELLGAQKICGTTGPNGTFFTSGHLNIVTSNPILSIQGLQTAMKILAAQKDADNEPIMINGMILMVPPALEVTAQNILNGLQIRVNDNTSGPGGGTAGQFLYAQNWMKGKLTLVVNPYIPVVASSSNGDTTWFVIADPNDADSRPAFFFNRLIGYETPQLLMKAPNAVNLGGGPANAMDGSFENDVIDYKMRHFFGALQGDTKMAVASNGSGS